jgi:hypothetical protein
VDAWFVGLGDAAQSSTNPMIQQTSFYSRTIAFNCDLNASTIFECAAFTSASVRVFSVER